MTPLGPRLLANFLSPAFAEPLAADDAFRSLYTGIRQPGVEDPATIADGLNDQSNPASTSRS